MDGTGSDRDLTDVEPGGEEPPPYLEVSVLVPQPLHLGLQPPTLLHHFLHLGILQCWAQRLGQCGDLGLGSRGGDDFIDLYVMLMEEKREPERHHLWNPGFSFCL